VTPADEVALRRAVHGRQLALFVDYDGTLTPIRAHPAQAAIAEPVRAALAACARRPDTDVTIVSGRALADVAAAVGLSQLTYAGNHGLEIAGPGLPSFRHEDLAPFAAGTTALAAMLAALARDGAWVEEKGATLTFHYRAVPPAAQPALAAEARAAVTAAGFRARDGHCAVEARPPVDWDKGRAVLHVLRARYGSDWARRVCALYVGDDVTDEDAFRALAGTGCTFRVGPADVPTAAARRLGDVDGVLALLEWVAAR
jgi:trehalose-phosphatase